MSTASVKTGFRKCGIYPPGRNAINKNRFTQYQAHHQALCYLIQFQCQHLSTKNHPGERSYEESVTPANNEPSSNVSKLNQTESPSTPVNPIVGEGIIPLHILELLLIPAAKEQMQTISRVLT